jgi:DNA (cytosine-5)-methyltransferase 1
MLRLLDLFSGIGGFSLGLERSGAFKTVAFCEIEPYCQKVLAKHWPQVPIYDDVRTITAERLTADGITVDAICGGFPCQDISCAGKRAGIEGERSGLWFEYARIIGEFRPRYVIVENVSALLSRGLDQVLGTLASFGYDAEWHCIPASAIGAPHRRDRVWIVAYPDSQWELQQEGAVKNKRRWFSDSCKNVSDAYCCNGSAWMQNRKQTHQEEAGARLDYRIARYGDLRNVGRDTWAVEPDVGRVANGVPARTHRLKALGNAVVPQIPELIGRAIAAREAA